MMFWYGGGDARRILDQRLSGGEIDAEEYRRLRDLIDDKAGRSAAGNGGGAMTAVPDVQPEALHGPAGRPRPVRGYASGKDDYLLRLRKIEGQVRGLQKMIEGDAWCPDVVTQVASATRALQEVAVGLLNDHLRHCVTAAAADSPEERDARLGEVTATIRQVIRL